LLLLLLFNRIEGVRPMVSGPQSETLSQQKAWGE
jgi:hypothetical protein